MEIVRCSFFYQYLNPNGFGFAKDKKFHYICQRLVGKKNEWKEQVYCRSNQSRSFGFQTVEAGASAEQGNDRPKRKLHTTFAYWNKKEWRSENLDKRSSLFCSFLGWIQKWKSNN